MVALGLAVRRQRYDDAIGWAGLRRRTAWAGATAAAVALVAWAQPLIEQFTSEGDGNLTRLVRTTAQNPDTTIGYSRAVQMVAKVLLFPPWWLRPSFGRAWLPSADAVVLPPEDALLPGLALSLVAVVGLATALAVLAGRARRRGDRAAGAALGTALVGIAGAVATAGQAPHGLFGIPAHHFRWLWPLGAFTVLAAATALRPWSPARPPHRILAAGVAVTVVVVAALNLPTYSQGVGPGGFDFALPVLGDLGRQMAVLEGRGPLLVDLRGESFASPYGAPIMAELQRRGIPFVVDEPGLVRQLGPTRRFDGTNATATLRYRVGDGALTTPRGTRRVAIHQALDRRRRRELAALRVRLAAYLEDHGVELNQRGREALAAGDLPRTARPTKDGTLEGEFLLASRAVVFLVQRDLLALGTTWAPVFRRYADLQDRHDTETVALFLGPPP